MISGHLKFSEPWHHFCGSRKVLRWAILLLHYVPSWFRSGLIPIIIIHWHWLPSILIHSHPSSIIVDPLLSNHLAKKYNHQLKSPQKKTSLNIPGQPSYHSRRFTSEVTSMGPPRAPPKRWLLQSRYTTHCNATCNIIHSHIVIMCIPSISHMYVYMYIYCKYVYVVITIYIYVWTPYVGDGHPSLDKEWFLCVYKPLLLGWWPSPTTGNQWEFGPSTYILYCILATLARSHLLMSGSSLALASKRHPCIFVNRSAYVCVIAQGELPSKSHPP